MARKNSDQEKPPPLGYVPRGVASKDAGVACSQDAKRKMWAIHPEAKGMEQGTGEGLAQEPMHGWMHRLCAFPPPLR
jgi:hypothetical protein